MGLIDCPKHGLKGIFFGISTDVAHNVYACRPMKNDEVVHITSLYDTNLYPLNEYIISKTLFDVLGLKKAALTTQKEAGEMYDLLKEQIALVCVTCLREFIAKNQLHLPIYPGR